MDPNHPPASWTRRRLLGSMMIAGSAAGVVLGGDPVRGEEPSDEVAEREGVEKQARDANLGPLKLYRTERFQVLGTVSETYLRTAGGDCEAVARDFIAHFRSKGFAVDLPARRLTVVALADEADYGKFLGESRVSLASGGRYDLKTNRLVVYDYRPAREQVGFRVSWLNLTTLAHEVTHLLCYNSGILDRVGDAPRSIVEGLATYTEERPPNARRWIGRVNDNRLEDLAHLQRRTPWMTVESLLVSDDALFGKAGGLAMLLGYAQSWLLVYYFLSHPERVGAFRAYLASILTRRDAKNRRLDAETHFGRLDELDRALKRFSIDLLKSR
ncbi:MAG: DUF1570 domain-containing protein [Isosphaeraceae bacterium]|nr:DUF1570 domain-containing protein [Isosphaeraceae bacterium]